jgi:hypothetical protein
MRQTEPHDAADEVHGGQRERHDKASADAAIELEVGERRHAVDEPQVQHHRRDPHQQSDRQVEKRVGQRPFADGDELPVDEVRPRRPRQVKRDHVRDERREPRLARSIGFEGGEHRSALE